METHKQTDTDWFQPFAGWEAAARWNRATFDWVAKGWQQWVALMTTVPPHFVVPPTVTPESSARERQPVIATRAMARAEPQPGAKKTAPRKKAKKASTRG